MSRGRGKASLMILTLALTLVLTASMASTPLVRADGGPVKLKVRTQPYILGEPVGAYFFVSVDIESPYAWDLTLDGIVGWTFDVYVDPDVLIPWAVVGANFGYFLYDCVDLNQDPFGPFTGENYPSLLVGEVNKTEGFFEDVAEFIMGYEAVGKGAGGNSTDPLWYGATNGLCKLRFRSNSQTGYSLINITDAAYYTADGTKHLIPDEDITVGHYNPPPPHAEFTYTPDMPQVDEEVTFNASASYDPDGIITSYEWNFGDNATAIYVEGVNLTDSANHTYTSPGTYDVRLNVTDNDGLWDETNKSITIYGPPVANFSYSPSEPSLGETVTFDATLSYDPDGGNETYPSGIVSHTWDFGDETTGTGSFAAHKYFEAGTYTVTLNVTDDEEAWDIESKNVTVSGGGAAAAEFHVEVVVGSIHFRGEIAEFYILTSFMGEPVNVTQINSRLYHGGTLHADLSESAENVTTGLYRMPFTISVDAPVGTYVLVVNASLFAQKGIGFASFLLSSTLTDWNALLISIDGTVGTIETNVGIIDVKLDNINAMLIEVNGTVATINSTIGLIVADVSTIDAKLTDIEDDVATIESTLGSIEEDIDDINSEITSIDGTLATIQTDIGSIQTDVAAINAKLTAINGSVGTIETDVGSIEERLDDIDARIVAIEGGLATISSTVGDIQLDLDDVAVDLVTVQGDIEKGIANVTAAITDAEGNIMVELGSIEVKLEDINATLASIDGSLVVIKTDIGTIKGKITSIQGDIATIETDIGIIKATLQEWTGLTTSSITTPVGTFDVMLLTNSTLEGPATFSDSTLTVIVSGETGTTGILNVMIPRQLLVGLGTKIDEFAVTINGRRVSFTYAEEAELYMVRIIYTHSIETIRIYLSGLQRPLLPLWILSVIVLSIAIALIGPTVYILRARKKPAQP